MRDFYAFGVKRRQTSRFDGQPYYDIDCAGVDPETKQLDLYKTYAVTGYKNFDQWLPIIQSVSTNRIAWFSGNFKVKPGKENIINADGVPQLEDVVGINKFEQFMQYQIATGYITNGKPDTPLSDVAKQFFLE